MRGRLFRTASLGVLVGALTTSAAQPHLGSVEIAPLADAITFGRVRTAPGLRTVAVERYADGVLTGIDLSILLERPIADPIDLLRDEGWEAVRDRIVSAPDATRVTIPVAELGLPVDLRRHHVAAGTNYPEHAGEAEVEDGPFLFAKLVQPTGSRAVVSAGDGLLDYEVELAFVTVEPLGPGDRPATTGLVLCNDYTDRATLLRHVDVWNPTSGTGFTTGKSFPGYLPVGDLFVVPRDVRAFAPALELRLWVNDELRQRAAVADSIWDLDRMLDETWARRDVTWEHRGRDVSLLGPDGTLPDRTLVMSGTPAGTIFQGIGVSTRARGALAWIFGGWNTPLPRHVIDRYVHEARAAGTYLHPGDRVSMHVDHLGVIENEIVP